MPGRSPARLLLRLALNGIGPTVAYLSLRGPLRSDVAALAIGAAVPTLWSLVYAAGRRRVDPVALWALAGLGIALVVSLASGTGIMPLLLQHAVVTGVAGIACLASVLVGRPLLNLLRPALHRRHLNGLTAMIGVVLLGHAMLNVALALTLSTTQYLVVSRIAGWCVIGVGAVAVLAYRRRIRRSGPSTADRSEP